MDKNEPKTVIIKKHKFYPDSAFCPNCEAFVGAVLNKPKICSQCNQKLKYEEEME